MDATEVIFVPMVLFLVIVAPIWIIMHYRTQRQRDEFSAKRDDMDNEELRAYAEKLEQRLEALETILDAEAHGWRKSQ